MRDVTSDWVWVRISLQADPPRRPRVRATAGDGRLVVAVTNPPPGRRDDSLSAPVRNEIKLRAAGDIGDGVCVAVADPNSAVDVWAVASGVAYEIAAEAVALNGLRRHSAWVR